MKKTKIIPSFLSALAALAIAAPSLAEAGRAGLKVTNWQAPGTWAPQGTLADQTGPMPFVPIAPCRVADTRVGFGFSGAYGPPSIGGGTSRTFDISGSGCTGIPSTAAAFSFNFTVTNTAGPGFIQAYPAGGSAGGSSAVNYTGAGQTVANAAVTPAGTGGNAGKITITVGVSTTDVIIDINGYYSGAPSSGQGMTLTSNGASDGLTVNTTGSGKGIKVNADTTGYSLWSVNASSSCAGTCGGLFGVSSTVDGAIALSAVGYSSTSRSVGVYGTTAGAGVGDTVRSEYLAAGVLGEASNTTTVPWGANVAGVVGVVRVENAAAMGVYGEARSAKANGGMFKNIGGVSPVVTYVSSYDPVVMGLNTNGQIYGSNGLQISGGTKNFVTPHPQDPSREIAYVAPEGPSSDVFFRGTGTLRNGSAVIPVPDHFRLVARQDSYQTTLTVVGRPALLWVEAEGPDGIVVRGPADERFHYVVWGERDEFRDQEPVRANTHFTPEAMEKTQALKTFPESTRTILVRNGTLNPDGTYNQETARRLGWNVPEPQVGAVSPSSPVDLTGK